MPASLRHLNQLAKEREEQTEKSIASAVLAKWPNDQKYYAVEVLACDKKDRKCKVRFEDTFECWMSASDLHLQLNLAGLKEDELVQQIVCCICDDGQSKAPNEIVICDTCQQGYHLNCHEPALNKSEARLDDEDEEWMCRTCSMLLNLPDTEQEKPKSAVATAAQALKTSTLALQKAKTKPRQKQPEKKTKIKLSSNEIKREKMPMTSTPLVAPPPPVEAIAPAIKGAAAALVEKDETKVETKNFVALLSDPQPPKSKTKAQLKAPHGTKKIKKPEPAVMAAEAS